MKTTIINLGKCDYNGSGRKNLCTVKLELKEKECFKAFEINEDDVNTLIKSKIRLYLTGEKTLHDSKGKFYIKDSEQKEKMIIFSASANVYNNKQTDICAGGQMIDELIEYFPQNKQLKRIIEIWNEYHLNDLTTSYDGNEWLCKEIPSDIINEIEEIIKNNN